MGKPNLDRDRDPSLGHLNAPQLIRKFAYFGGKWQAADDGAVIAVNNPANGRLIGHVPDLGEAETRRAIDTAETAFDGWRRLLPQERAAKLRAWYDLMMAHRDDLALIMTVEQGKPLAEAKGEIDYAAGFIEWFAEEAKRVNGETVGGHLPNRVMTVRRAPIGVVAAVTPWNFPSAMITRKAAAAMAAGCPVIVRPASETPFSALALAELADRAGIPAGVFSVLTGSRAIVQELCANDTVRAMSFTGSTEVGRILLRQSADTVKRMTMELGGHAPFLLFPDTDLDAGVAAALDAKFQTSGQDCLAANRIYVHADVYDAFVEKFTEAVKAFTVGAGLDPASDIGPLTTANAVAKCAAHVDDARAKGARVLCGGAAIDGEGFFFEPTVLADVTPDMAISTEETFGPVAAITRFDSEEELTGLMNHADYGLVAYLYSRDHDRICRLTDRLEFGMVAVNCVKVTGAPIPFGGVKQSGLGREGGHWGLDEFTDTKYVCAAYQGA